VLASTVLLVPVGGAAAATGSPVVLPSTRIGLSATPPMPAPTPLLEQRFPGSIASRERVLVGVGPNGQVRALRVVQRLELAGLGDYVFAVGAPVLEVRAGRGSRSEPGLRRGAILWQGFSPGRRTLVADARLRLAEGAGALPLRVSRAGDRLVLENTTDLETTAFSGGAPAADVSTAVQAARQAAATGGVADGIVVRVTGTRSFRVRVDAPLAVEGQVGGRRFRAVLGGGRPLRLVVPAGPGRGFEVTARPFLPAGVLSGRPTLGETVVALLRLARVRQYNTFLSNPDPRGRAQAVYVFRPARAAPRAETASRGGSDGWSALGVVAALGLAVASFGGLLVLWARS
jgi:hypothetical protein